MLKLNSAQRLQNGRRSRGDREVLISFQDPSVRTPVLDALWDQPKLLVEGQELSFYLDVCPLMLKKCRE